MKSKKTTLTNENKHGRGTNKDVSKVHHLGGEKIIKVVSFFFFYVCVCVPVWMRFSSGVFFNHHSPSNESKLDPTPSDKDVAPTHRLGFDEVEERVSLNMASDKLASFFFF